MLKSKLTILHSKKLCFKALALTNSILHSYEVRDSETSYKKKLPHTPIFIIGAPRSGSTLLYQVLTDYYNIGYLSNLHALFYGAPSLIEHYWHPLKWRQPSDYTSRHGKTKERTAPSECGQFWYRFFPRQPHYTQAISTHKMLQLRTAVQALSTAFNKPILFKNLYCSLRLQPIAKALPEALYIIIHRNVIDNGHSLLEGRKKVYGHYDTWWSAEPPAIEQLKKLPPHQQVIEQVCHIYAQINRDKQEIGPEHFIDLYYEDFCENVHKSLNSIEKFFKAHEVDIYPRISITELPTSFPRRSNCMIDWLTYSKMIDYVQNSK